MTELESIYSKEISNHRNWLKTFGTLRLDKWENLLKKNAEGAEAAICEAKTRILLSDHNIDIKPYEDLSKGGPDFLCSKDGKTFYVETTCISIKAATKESGLYPTDSSDIDDSSYGNMTEKFRSEICNKILQCSKVKAPCIVVIATLHSKASDCCIDELAAEELLTATTYITHDINNKTHEPVGNTYESTNLRGSAFIRRVKGSSGKIEFARNPISAILLCAFGYCQAKVVGALHPKPNYIFDRTLLPNIPLAQLTAESLRTGYLTVEWI